MIRIIRGVRGVNDNNGHNESQNKGRSYVSNNSQNKFRQKNNTNSEKSGGLKITAIEVVNLKNKTEVQQAKPLQKSSPHMEKENE